ncbi:alpha/beta fold hydrolase [Ramlibacter sp. G-1-2-2]|uniref:Alpha/beta fold hydrolase n=1 Tax=Ramlibacter agri TaxID=2728837 RepID=A0A848H993_9BURK|nr:alpha/beta fold hydrolase [Ramlibacter agri]NML47556.1 alpha/beta fold hydrolase [Ramlibacter agri]
MKPEETRTGKAGPTAYTVQGRGEPVVLVHGVGMARAVWAQQAEALARECQVVSYDMLGHGSSDVPPEGVTLADYARQLEALLDHLGIAQANVVGHSMGALVALEFALACPERTLRVAAVNAVFQRTPEQRAAVQARAAALGQEGAAATIAPTLERWFGNPVPAPLRESADLVGRLLREVNPVGYARTYELFASSDRIHEERLAGLAMPALFLTGELDANSSPAMSQAMARLAPRAQAVVLPRARHMMNVTHPLEVNGALRNFLAGKQ